MHFFNLKIYLNVSVIFTSKFVLIFLKIHIFVPLDYEGETFLGGYFSSFPL